ncbi:MAG: WYL domain-containing protein [Magnetococcales bacterium]|nr:WYL domain-containing protein [Magnetococcales bacterium]
MSPDPEEKKPEDQGPVRHSVGRRLQFIEFCLFWEGQLNRSDIMNRFGISEPQASADLARYQELAPDNLVYDRSLKRYISGPKFRPVLVKPEANNYLTQLRALAEELTSREETWIVRSPVYDVAPTPRREINPNRLRKMLQAIREARTISIAYQSLSRPEPRWRWITPHALGFDGFRWHVRAYCHIDDRFKDFLLARIQGVRRETRERQIDPVEDKEWHSKLTVRIGPHPDFTPSQKRVVEKDYGMKEGEFRIHVRQALLYYLLKRLGLDAGHGSRRPMEQHIVLLNRQELEEKLGRPLWL